MTSGCGPDALTFELHDPQRRFSGVRLVPDFVADHGRLDLAFDQGAGSWRLRLPRSPAWRFEYRLECRLPDGTSERVCDPANPRRVGGAFGDKSVLECADYTHPAWLRVDAAPGDWREFCVESHALQAKIGARIWSPATPTDRIVVVHDGPEYDKFAALGQYSAAMIASGRVAAYHLVLLDPGERNEWYSANPSYAHGLGRELLPRLKSELDSRRPVVGVGTSLGGLAMLHAQRRYPSSFAGLFLQSGSFFRPRHDRYESRFVRYRRIVRFVDALGRASGRIRPAPPAVLTCGLVEQNLTNNRAMAKTLERQGYQVQLYEVPDAHNFTGWRDALDPGLTELLRRVWGSPRTEHA